ncbi:MAG: DMT family transporter [bacterium]|nr:DMT family transporter [bacterium]
MLTQIPYLGEISALATAFIWGLAVILFKKSGETVHPIGLNLVKNLLAVVLILITMVFIQQTFPQPVSSRDYWLLILSGALGIGISDTLFFMCLNRLGAGLTAIIDCLYSPFVIGLSILWLKETLSLFQIFGVLLIILAILVATQKKGRAGLSTRDLFWGIFFGVLAMVTVAVGIVVIKPILSRSPLLWVSLVRFAGGVGVLILVLLFHPRRRSILTSIIGVKSWGYTLSGSFVGAYLALIIWLAGMKFTQVSTAAALNQTSSVFVFIFAALILKEPINLQRTAGIVMAVAGVFMVTFG